MKFHKGSSLLVKFHEGTVGFWLVNFTKGTLGSQFVKFQKAGSQFLGVGFFNARMDCIIVGVHL